MDFPKSVPGVGLVNGKFIDEDPLAATPGSLIPAAWGNAVTLELLNVIEDGGLVPDEADTTQLSAAIKQLVDAGAVEFASKVDAETGTDTSKAMSALRVFQAIAKVITQATEGAYGWLKIATQVIVNAGTDDTAAVTSKKLAKAVQAQAFTAFTTDGDAGSLMLSPVPAISAYAAPQRFRVKFNQASTGNDTINVSGKGAKNLKQYDSAGAKVAAVYAIGQLADIELDGEDFILLDRLPTSSTDSGLAGVSSRLRITTDGTTGQAAVVGSSIFLNGSNGRGVYVAINSTVSIAVAGLGGLDTGAPAANTFYYIWAVRIGGVVSLVLSANSTAPSVATVPATALVSRLGTVRTGAVATVLRPGLLRGKKYQCDPKPGSNFTALTSVASVSGSISATAVNISSEVPPTAVSVEVCISANASGSSMAATVTPRAGSGSLGVSMAIPAGATSGQKGTLILAESIIYWATAFTGSGTANLYIAGWEEE